MARNRVQRLFLYSEAEVNGLGLEAYDVTTVGAMNCDLEIGKNLRGRRQILSSVDQVTDENVIEVLNKALAVHAINRQEEIFLKKYERGLQPILFRQKEYNAHINNKVVVNIANQIVTFKTSEFAGEPIQYISRGTGMRVRDDADESEPDGETIPEKVARINSMMLSEGKRSKDYNLAYEMFTCGVGYRLVIHDTGDDETDYLDEAPFEMYIPKSENTFVVRRSDVTRRVLMGVTYVFKDNEEKQPEYTVYTPNVKYTIEGVDSEMKIVGREKHNFGQVTLIEYPCNPNYMGAFEPVVPLLDAVNLTLSNKLDGIEQFIQALMVFDGVDISREDFLELKDLGAIKLPATQNAGGGRKLYYLNEQLDQSQTQTVIDGMYKHILRIVGMPSQGDGNTSDSSNNGAMIIKNGWWDAEARMQETQSMWMESETAFLKVVLKMCSDANELDGLRISDLEPKFWRQSYEDLLVKTQSFSTLRTSGMPAIQAFTFSHLSRDPESDAIVYDEYQQKLADELDRMNGVSDSLPLDEDDTVNPTEPGGVMAQAEAAEESGGRRSGEGSKGQWAICPVCGKRFQKREERQVYDSIACANKARKDNGIGFRR